MLEIQEYKDKYDSEIIELILSIQQEEFNVPIDLDAQPDLKNITGFYQKGKGNFWIALFDGKLVGTIALIDIGNNEGAIRKMFVHKDFRGKAHGIAGSLLKILMEWIRKKQITAIYLGTREEFHAAHRFYEKNGFKEIAGSVLPVNFPVMPTDNKFYGMKCT